MLLPSPVAIVVNHLLRHVLLVTERRTAAGPTVCAARAAPATGVVGVVWTGTASTIAGDGLFDDLLLDFGIGLSRFGRLAPCDAEGKRQDNNSKRH